MRKILYVTIILLIISILFCGCALLKNKTFGELETGENFMHSRDGHCKKLPNNYGLYVDLSSTTTLFKVLDEYVNEEFTSSVVFENSILEAHYIKGYFNDNYLALCEEHDDDSLSYVVFEFSDESIENYTTEDEVCSIFETDSIEWFTLCNTNEEIIDFE